MFDDQKMISSSMLDDLPSQNDRSSKNCNETGCSLRRKCNCSEKARVESTNVSESIFRTILENVCNI